VKPAKGERKRISLYNLVYALRLPPQV